MATPKVAFQQIKQAALGYPGAELAVILGDHPVIRVKDKVFVWLGEDDGGFGIGVRLPESQDAAMALPFVEPMGYGMAKWGWVNVAFKKGQDVPVDLMLQWVRESYRKVAPKKLAAQLDGPKAAPAPARPAKPARKAQPKAKARPSARR